MRKHSLKEKGLSLSQAQSISNLCHQKVSEIDSKIQYINNFSKTILIDNKAHILQKGKPIPSNIVELLKEKCRLHACQGFLMENIKIKSTLMEMAKHDIANTSSIIFPEEPIDEIPKIIATVTEEYGWGELSISDYNEYIEAEAYSAHIGQFIHRGSILHQLRDELPKIPDIEWMEVTTGVKTPITINQHHTTGDLMSLHETLSQIHRKYEQRVNFFKSKVKNIVTQKNSEISKLNNLEINRVEKENKIRQNEYNKKYLEAIDMVEKIKSEFEIERQRKIKEISELKISVDPRFQPVVDELLKNIE